MGGSRKRTALITGGSSGIGLELAKLFANDDYQLVLVAKPLEELEKAKETLKAIKPELQILLMQQDLAQPGAAQEVYEFTRKHDLELNVLVNCAGFGTYGFVNEIDMKKEIDMLQLNVSTLYQLTRLYLSEMVERDEGKIINMSSISAFQPSPTFATYGATKSFILQFSRALNYELREQGSNVRVLAVCPTAVRETRFQSAACMEKSNTFNSWMATTADVVARDTYQAMHQGKDMAIPGRGLGLLHSIVNRLPTSWLMKFSRAQLKEK